jgi:hypothetical protein
VQTTCQPPSAWRKDPWPATICDISTGGLCLCLNRRFEPGSGLAIELPGEDGSTHTVLARVASVHTAPEGGWLLGCTFISELGDNEVRAVLEVDPLRQASLDDAATPTRRGMAASVEGVLFQTRSAQGEVLRWFVKRLDLSGRWPIPARRPVSFRVAGQPGEALRVDLIIKKCRRIGSYWIIDCKFRTPPSDDILRALTTPSEQDALA